MGTNIVRPMTGEELARNFDKAAKRGLIEPVWVIPESSYKQFKKMLGSEQIDENLKKIARGYGFTGYVVAGDVPKVDSPTITDLVMRPHTEIKGGY